MATAEADICNKALARIGITEYIDDLTTDQSEEAQTCNVFYTDLRDACLAAFPWPFATLRQVLTIKADEPLRDGWRNVFALPAKCLKPRKIWPTGLNVALFQAYPFLPGQVPPVSMNPRTPRSDQRIPYAIEKSSTDDTQVLLCDLDTPSLFYTAQVTDPVKFPPMFVEALAWLIASEIASPLTKDPKKVAYAEQKYNRVIREAWADALNSVQEDIPPDSEMIIGRL
jgi:hypothetical protein